MSYFTLRRDAVGPCEHGRVTDRYEEAFATPTSLRISGLATMALCVGLLVLVAVVPDRSDDPAAASIGATAAVAVGLLGAGLATMRMRVVLAEVLDVRVRPLWWRRRIDPSTITALSTVTVDPRAAGGFGARISPGHGTVVLLSAGPGLRVSVAGMRDVTFRCSEPDRLAAMLVARGAAADPATPRPTRGHDH